MTTTEPGAATTSRTGDPAGLGRGSLTRRLPVWWQAEAAPPTAIPYPVDGTTRASRFLLRVLFSAPALTVPAAALGVLWQVGEALAPVIAGAAIDRALATGDPAALVLWLLVLAVNFLVLSLSFRFASQLTARATEVVQHRLRATLSARVLHPQEATGRRPDGAVVSTMTNDVARIAALGLVVFPVAEAAGVVFIAVSLLLIHPILGTVVIVGAPLAVWLMGLLSRSYARASREYQTLLAGSVGTATDLVSGYRVIKGIRAEAEATRRYRVASQQTLAGAIRSVSALGRFTAGSDTISGVFIAGVAALAGWFAITGELSVGGLIAAVGLAQGLLPPMQMLTGNAVPLAAAAHASASRVLEQLVSEGRASAEDEPAASAAAPPDAPRGVPQNDVPSVQVSLRTDAGPVVIRVEAGELVGVRADDRVAARIARALLHPQEDEGASVRVDGRAADRLADSTYRSQVIVAPHHDTLFTGTIAQNLTAVGAPRSGWDEALQAAGCTDVVDGLGGLDAPIGERGSRLSGGQRQRVALARALAVDAPVLVLHDPTTAVDAVTESSIADGLRAARRRRSTILLTNSPALLAVCDRIVDLGGKGAA